MGAAGFKNQQNKLKQVKQMNIKRLLLPLKEVCSIFNKPLGDSRNYFHVQKAFIYILALKMRNGKIRESRHIKRLLYVLTGDPVGKIWQTFVVPSQMICSQS